MKKQKIKKSNNKISDLKNNTNTKTKSKKDLKSSFKKNSIIKNEVLYFIIVLIITTITSVLLHISLLHTGIFKNMDVLFYRGIFLLILVVIIIALLLFFLKDKYLKINIKDIICIVIVIFSFNLTFFTLVPVTIDRSVTVFTLGKFDKAIEKSLTKEEMEKIFIDDYVYEKGAFDKRFKEQVTTGSIKKDENSDKYVLTDRGKKLIKLFELIGRLYNVDLTNMSK